MDTLLTRLTQVVHYDLVQSREAYIEAIQALAERTRKEGHPGVLSYRFFTSSTEETAASVITYADAGAWAAHHQLAYQWKEMPRLQATVKLKRLTLYGPLNEAVASWRQQAGLAYTHYDQLAAGFERD